MKNCYIILISIVLFSSLFSIGAKSQDEGISISLLGNEGLFQYSDFNYTLDCEDANSNNVAVIMEYSTGGAYITVTHRKDDVWIGEGFRQLDRQGKIYNFQFLDNGLYRLRAHLEMQNETIYRDFFINVIGGDGTYATGDVEEYIAKGKWIDTMMIVYGYKDFNSFKSWGEGAFVWKHNPFYIFQDFLVELLIFLIIPQVDMLIITAVGIFIIIYRKRIRHIWEQFQIEKRHGKIEDKIGKIRVEEEKERRRRLEAYPTRDALLKYGEGDIDSRSVAYNQGLRGHIKATYSTAYSLVNLGEMYYNKRTECSDRATIIIEELSKQYSATLEKSWIFRDISASCFALCSEAVEVKTQKIVKAKWMAIAEMASHDAREEIAKVTQEIELKYDGKTFADVIEKKREEKEDESVSDKGVPAGSTT